MMDRILGFAGGSVSGFVAWIAGFVNLQNVIEVLIITLIGGIGGVLGNWIGQAIIRKCSQRKSKGNKLPMMILVIFLFFASGAMAQSYQVNWECENHQVFLHGEISVSDFIQEINDCQIVDKYEFYIRPYMEPDSLHPQKGLYPNRETKRLWTYGDMTVREYLRFLKRMTTTNINCYLISPIYKGS